jgi:hypothetical protein
VALCLSPMHRGDLFVVAHKASLDEAYIRADTSRDPEMVYLLAAKARWVV